MCAQAFPLGKIVYCQRDNIMMPITKRNIVLLCAISVSFFALGYFSRNPANTEVKPSLVQGIRTTLKPPPNTVFDEETPKCVDLLKAVQNGYWVSRTPTKRELSEIQSFLSDIRTGRFNLPPTLQRSDGRCGNINFEGQMFRALCDPDGPTPCCFKNHCASKSVSQCRCSNCFDPRAKLHAEFGTYVIKDPACKMTIFKSKADICSLLKGVSINFIGDSLVRYVYNAFLSLFRPVYITNAEKTNTSKSGRERCRKQRMYLPNCGRLVEAEVSECDHTVELHDNRYYTVAHANKIMSTVKGRVGKRHSIIYIGLGLHDHLNATTIHERIVKPMMRVVGKNQWPKILWATPHAAGLLKSPYYSTQSNSAILAFNKDMKRILKGYNIPVLDTYPLTKDVVSVDGTHFGWGVNDMKTQILLNLVQRLKKNGWSGFH